MTHTNYLELIQNDPQAATNLFVEKDQALLEKDQEILKLQQHLINATKARFGTKSEKLSNILEHPSLFSVEELVEPANQEELPTVTIPEHKRAKKRSRREIQDGTPVRRIEHPPIQTE